MPSLPLIAQVNTGDTAWMLMATALVILMTIGLGVFYAGLVRSKNSLNTFMMCIAALAVATVMWALVGYSFAFAEGNGIIGGFGYVGLHDVTFVPKEGTTKVRIISIPAIRDRVVQGALKLILEPIFEADFQPGSFGYRPKRTAHAAVKLVADAIVRHKTHVIDLDLKPVPI